MNAIYQLTHIVQAAAAASTAPEQVEVIVEAIHQSMDVEVCSLYLNNPEGAMALVASHGLSVTAIGSELPRGSGLVGWVTANRQPLNIVDPQRHEAYQYLPGSEEERFGSFCGIPIVRTGVVIGVLTVQCVEARILSQEEEAFLVTLGAQLAFIVDSWLDWDAAKSTSTRNLHGVRGAPGIGLGQIQLCEDINLLTVVDEPCQDIEDEVSRWLQLVEQVQAEVRTEQSGLGVDLSLEVSAVFDAYHMLLADPSLVAGVTQGIREGRALPSALKRMISHYAELFLAMEDPYLRARNEDIKHLGNRLYETWRGRGLADVELEITTPVVLVGEQVSISDIAGVPKEYLAGIVCFGGSVMSHTAVLANALGVPAVMGLGELKGICNGETIIVDGDHGAVVLHPDEAIQKEYELLLHARLQEEGELSHWRDRPALTLDGHRVQLYANSGLLADISPGINNGAEGLGLYRTEIPFMISETFPSEQAQVDTYQQVFNAYQDKPVYMRILDIGGDKPLPYFPIHEENPALGWRGIRICLDNTSLLMTQLRAMLRAAIGRDTLHILLPMVSAYDELLRFHSVLHDALDQLKKEGHCVTRPPVGIMVEVPAAISQLAKWRDQIDFVSIGSNDLSQYLLAADRNNPRVASTYDHLHPAVLVEIQRVVDSAKSLGLPLCLCGEMSSDPLAVLLLVGMGVRRLSMSAAHLPRVKKTICQVDTKSCERLLEESLCLRDADDIRNILSTHMEAAGSLS